MWSISRITNSYNSSVQNNCQNDARTVPHIHGHKRVDDNATENVNLKQHLRLKREAAFETSREYVTLHGLKGLKCAVVCYFQGRIFNLTNSSCGALYRIDYANMSNLIQVITALCNNLEHLHLTR